MTGISGDNIILKRLRGHNNGDRPSKVQFLRCERPKDQEFPTLLLRKARVMNPFMKLPDGLDCDFYSIKVTTEELIKI
jgi:hypothetical protein